MATPDCEFLTTFPCSCKLGENCILRASHARLREAHRHWHTALDHYASLDGLRTYLNGTIQALRNVTFTLQSAKSKIPQFEQWYGGWRRAFQADPIMKWAVQSRNRVVKDRDLEPLSMARVLLVGSSDGKPMMQFSADPAMKNRAIAAQLLGRLSLSDSLRRDGVLQVERLWIDHELKGSEVLDALVHVFGRLAQLLYDCHTQIEASEPSDWPAVPLSVAHLPDLRIDRLLRPACMIAFEDRRTTWIRVRDGAEIEIQARELEPHAEIDEVVRKRYGTLRTDALLAALTAKTLAGRAREFWNVARRMMEIDGYHVSMVWLIRDGAPVWYSMIEFPDNASKHLYWDEIRRQVEKTAATEIVVVGEIWLAKFDPRVPDRRAQDASDRVEALAVNALNSKGESIEIVGHVERIEGATKVGEPEEHQDAESYYLDDVREVWGLPRHLGRSQP